MLLLLACTGKTPTDGNPSDDSSSDSTPLEDTAPELAGEDLALFTSSAKLEVWLNANYDLPEDSNAEWELGEQGDWTALADFDGDGLDDFWQIEDTSQKVRITMNGGGTYESEPSFEPTSGVGQKRPAIAGDFDGDGKADMMLLNTTSGRALTFLNVTGGFDTDNKIAAETALGEVGDFAAADMDGDGTEDLVQLAGSDIRIWKVNEGLIDETAALFELNLAGNVQALGIDLDDDGVSELALWSGSTLKVYANDGSTITTEQHKEFFLNTSGFAMAGDVR